jgi:hypothetical protein
MTTTAQPITLDPGRTPAPMEPIQGGQMLYTFYGAEPYDHRLSEYDGQEYPVFPQGLINQEGKLVSAPAYHHVVYIYDEAGQRVIGLATVKEREITIYGLDGTSRVLPVEGYRVEVFPGGRYAIVHTAQGMTWDGGSSVGDPLEEGIFDLQENKFVVEPKAGQMIQYNAGGVALGYQYDSEDATGSETAQWAFKMINESPGWSIVELPLSLGRIQQYFPETGWFGGLWMERPGNQWTMHAYEQRVYDENLEVIPSLSGWSIDYEGFRGGQWCVIYNNNAFPDVSTWVDRNGELSERRDAALPGTGWRCYLLEDGTLLDGGLNEVVSPRDGESLLVLHAAGTGTDQGFLHLNADGSIKAAYDLAGKPMQASEAFRCWQSFRYDVIEDGAYTLYAAKGGQWAVLDLSRFQPAPKQEHRDGVPYANPIVMCEDFIVIETGVHWYEAGVKYDFFAIDWDGNKLDDCPLEPFFSLLSYQTAGEQGPNYFWIAQEDGKRGYINTRGEWLFVDEN